MRIHSVRFLVSGICAVLTLIGMPTPDAQAGGSIEILHNFDDSAGAYPFTDLVIDRAGNLYGMAVQGGDFNAGTVFQLSPSGSDWVTTVLHNFTGGADGGQPYGGVTLDADGNVYGTAVIGGSGGVCVEDGCGVVWKLTHSNGNWTHSVIHDFTGGTDGFGPGGPVSFDTLGNLYGMTPTGGEYGMGIVFQLTPDGSGPWTETILHHFTGGLDGGSGSAGRLLIDVDQTIWGVTTVGGVSGVGTVFKIVPNGRGNWTFTTLYAFQGGWNDGVFPYGGLVRDASGNLYGTTYYGGNWDWGVIYRLTGVNGTWMETVLHHFRGGGDGKYSISGLVFGKDGGLYGTTSEGGGPCDCGTIFRLNPMVAGPGNVKIVYRFEGVPDGALPYSGLVADPEGNLYGATAYGGDDDDGTVFKFVP